MSAIPSPPHSTLQWSQLQRDRLAHIYARISQLEAEFQVDGLESLEKEHCELRDVKDSFSYDITTVPVEIILHIFILCLPTVGRIQPSSGNQ